jgi:ferritin-like metal-binding protein YciE
VNLGGFFGAQPDTPAKLAGFAYAFEHLEVAGYELLARVAERAADAETVAVAKRIAAQEEAAAERIVATWDAAVDATLADLTAV